MKSDKKKRAAAIAAVYAHMSSTEQVVYESGNAQESVSQPIQNTIAGQAFSLWAVSGRQAQMQAGTMMQLRMFK